MTYDHLNLKPVDDVTWATLDRPERLNALNKPLIEELRHFFTDLRERHDVRVVVLRGGGTSFCAGLDLKERGSRSYGDQSQGLINQRRISEIVIAMRRCPQPIIALLDGAAAGGGFALALASDVRIATPPLRMNAAFIKLGLSACDTSASVTFCPGWLGVRLPRNSCLQVDSSRPSAPCLLAS
jgi:enoyl-CoA hydratase/carnithine racemase